MATAFRLEHIHRRFGHVTALNDLSLEVQQGEIFGFLGRNGAGKTTAIRILMGVMQPDSGMIELFGSQVKRVNVTLKQRIGYVSQETAFYPWMNATELGRFVSGFYPSWDKQEFERLLQLLDVPSDRRSSELSGGTRTKLGLALALAPRPELLLLDEPTAGLDPVARREFNDQLIALHRERGTTVFFSSHIVGEVEQLAQRVGIIQAGQARFQGSITSLCAGVKQVCSPQPINVPQGFECLRADVYRADVDRWNEAQWPDGVEIKELSLEDIFLAFARTDSVTKS